jgi:hypothetical protein
MIQTTKVRSTNDFKVGATVATKGWTSFARDLLTFGSNAHLVLSVVFQEALDTTAREL